MQNNQNHLKNLDKDFVLRKSSIKTALLMAGLVIASAGCSIMPEAFTAQEIARINQDDRKLVAKDRPELSSPLTLDMAIARALKYNLEHRSKMLEQAYSTGILEASKFDMLPKIMTNAGYAWRSEEIIREARDSITGANSLANPYISQERQHNTTDVTFSWNLLDFGAGYYTAKQNADRVLISNERRRKAMHLLVQNVRTAFWRAAAAERLGQDVRNTIVEAEAALNDARKITQERVKSPNESLRYQRNLLENLRLLENVNRELLNARIELANYIGLEPSTKFEIELPENVNPQAIDMPISAMEELALANNADLREQFYNVRVAANETRKAIYRLLPGISFDYGNKYDNDRYLINDQWREAGVRVGFNLLNLLALPTQMKANELNLKVAESKRMALQMNVLTQVHLSRFQYDDALLQFQRANAIYEVDNQLAKIALGQEQSQMAGRLERVSASVTAILSSVRKFHAIAKVNEASSKMQATLGLEPYMANFDQLSVEELAEKVSVSLDSWQEHLSETTQTDDEKQGDVSSAHDASEEPTTENTVG